MKRNITILYADDEPVNLKIFDINFRKKYNVITALSGIEGLKKLEENKDIKVVVSDMKMPTMNGVEFISKAKEISSNIVCFILTGFDITNEISQAIENKLIHEYFRKPFDLKAINTAIDRAIL